MAPPKHTGPSFDQLVRDLKKQPAAVEDPDKWRDQKPAWCVSRCDLEGCPWSWEHADKDGLKQILRRLSEHEKRAWKEILLDTDGRGRKCNGEIDADHERIARDAKNRLRHLGLAGFDTLLKLRVDGPGRVWGIREGRALFIIWWDPTHSVYPLDDSISSSDLGNAPSARLKVVLV